MKRWRLRLAMLGAGLAVGATGAPTMAAWVDTAVNPTADVVSATDWVPPVIDRTDVVKSQGGMPGFIRPLQNYHVCSKITNTGGNPASALGTVTTNASALTTALTGLVGNLIGTGSPCPAGSTHDSGARVSLGLTNGSTHSITTSTQDSAGNAAIPKTGSVTIDSSIAAPNNTNTTVTTINGGTQYKVDQGDQIIFGFSEPIDPHSITDDGWDGSPRTLTISGAPQQGGNLTFPAAFPIISGQLTVRNNMITGNVTFPNSTIEAAGTPLGKEYRITLGAASNTSFTPTVTSAAATAMSFSTSTDQLFDRAGNQLTGNVSITEAAPADADF